MSTPRRCKLILPLFAALLCYSGQSYAQDTATTFLDYDPETGSLRLEDSIENRPPTTIELVSIAGVYTGEAPERLSLFDVYFKHKFFRMDMRGIDSLEFGPLMSPGIEPSLLASDLCLAGSRLGGGQLTNVELRVDGQIWPLTGDHTACKSVPWIPRITIDPIDFYLDYEISTGTLSLDSTGQQLSSILVRGDNIFIGETPDLPTDVIDIAHADSISFTDSILYYSRVAGFETADFGPIIEPGTPPQQLANSVCYKGRTIEQGFSGPLHIRSNGETFPIKCGGADVEFRDLDFTRLNEMIGQPVDLGVIVDPNDGTFIVHLPGSSDGATLPMTRLEITAEEPIFIPGAQNAGTLDGVFDSLTGTGLIKSDSNGFGTIDFGRILMPEIATGQLEGLIQVSGAFANGTAINSVQFVETRLVPESSAESLFFLGLLSLILIRRDWLP